MPILGPACAFVRCAALRDSLSVTYWEDAIVIAKALTRTTEYYDELVEDYERFRLHQEAMIEARLGVLVAGSLDPVELDLVFGNP